MKKTQHDDLLKKGFLTISEIARLLEITRGKTETYLRRIELSRTSFGLMNVYKYDEFREATLNYFKGQPEYDRICRRLVFYDKKIKSTYVDAPKKRVFIQVEVTPEQKEKIINTSVNIHGVSVSDYCRLKIFAPDYVVSNLSFLREDEVVKFKQRIKTPSLPNYIMIDGISVAVEQIKTEYLELIGIEWLKALLKHAEERRKKS